jgi:hypothetical protein
VTLSASIGHTQTLEDTVAQFYPQSLIDLAHDDPLTREQCFGILESDAGGAPRTVLAAYTNHVVAAVRVLRNSGAGFAVFAEPAGFDFDGSVCSVTVTNLNNDGKPDVLLTFSGGANSVDWVFSWDGESLTNLSPLTDSGLGTLLSELRNAELLDLNNDGIQEISSWTQRPAAEEVLPTHIYKWVSDHYELDQQVVGPWVFNPVSSSYTHRIPFDLPPNAQGPFVLKVVNGTAAAGPRVTSCIVRLNGEVVVGSADCGAGVASIERGVTLPASNVLEVNVGGSPQRQITVFIQAAGWTTP